jgi:nucleotide-binding universal stress UspA family protein
MADDAAPQGAILVALDGSMAAQAAAQVAIRFAKGLRRMIRGLYVIDEELVLDTYADHGAELGQAIEMTSRDDLVARFRYQGETALTWLSDQCRAAAVAVTTDVVLGRVSDSVLQEARGASLLALGRRGNRHSGDAQRLGQHFRAIAHHAACPVIAGAAAPTELRHLLLAYNGSDRARRALEWAARLQEALPAELGVVAVRQSSADNADEWIRDAREQLPFDARRRSVTRTGDPVAEIAAAAEEGHADLVVLGGYRHAAAVEWLVGSTVDGLLKRTPLPVVVA